MAQRTLTRTSVAPRRSRTFEKTTKPVRRRVHRPAGYPPTPHFPQPHASAKTTTELEPVDWMHVELPRSDYFFAGLVALSVTLVASIVTLVPAIVFFNWTALLGSHLWAKIVLFVPVASGIYGAWSCIQRAKSDRLRDRLCRELRD